MFFFHKNVHFGKEKQEKRAEKYNKSLQYKEHTTTKRKRQKQMLYYRTFSVQCITTNAFFNSNLLIVQRMNSNIQISFISKIKLYLGQSSCKMLI